MKKSAAILVIAIAGVVALAIFLSSQNFPKNSEESEVTEAEETADSRAGKNFDSKVNDEGGVTVAVTPISLFGESDEWKFEIILDTHSVELSYDITEIATLVDSRGDVYTPLVWEGDPPGGHHRGGVLVFARIEPTPTSASLLIRDIGGVAERRFEWLAQPQI